MFARCTGCDGTYLHVESDDLEGLAEAIGMPRAVAGTFSYATTAISAAAREVEIGLPGHAEVRVDWVREATPDHPLYNFKIRAHWEIVEARREWQGDFTIQYTADVWAELKLADFKRRLRGASDFYIAAEVDIRLGEYFADDANNQAN